VSEHRPLVWIVDDDASIRWVLERALARESLTTRAFEDGDSVIRALDSEQPDTIVTDIRMAGMSGLELMDALSTRAADIPVIVMTAHTDLDSAVSAYRGGAFEYLPKPFDVDDAAALVRRAIQHRLESRVAAAGVDPRVKTRIVGEAPAMQEVFRVIGRLAKSNMNVLICGESGTGKELVARALYETSPRAAQPFVAINTAAIPAELLESELFGHEKGSFTGAQTRRIGRFEQAHGGTLFLDEIGDMPANLQTRLLRVLSDCRFYRVGGHDQIEVDVRVIAATNQDLEARVRDGRFREDLFHRLNVISINLPPLRERREDVPALTRRFLQQAAEELEVEPKQLTDEAAAILVRHPWPGNVRQLENVCRRLTVMAPGQHITVDDLPDDLTRVETAGEGAAAEWEDLLRRTAERKLAMGETALLDELSPAFERVMLTTALSHTRGHKQAAAKCLGWGRNTLTRKLKELDVDG
jgi:two-component system nitrogen regulation response regulator GlnG